MSRDLELKKAIIEWVFENKDVFQLRNSCVDVFRQYIYADKGNYCIGGEEVSGWIDKAIGYVRG